MKEIGDTDSMRIAVVYSKPSKRLLLTPYAVADEDTEIIARMVVKGLEARGYTVLLCPITENQIEKIGEIKANCIFNLIEWSGLDIALAKKAFTYLRKSNIPVTGETEAVYTMTDNKIIMKQALKKAKISMPHGVVFETGKEEIDEKLHFPVIVKPAYEHCSTGLGYDSIAYNDDQLKLIVQRQIVLFRQPVIAEEFIVGRELLVYLLAKKAEVQVLPIEEVVFSNHHPTPFQTYESKWNVNHDDYNTSTAVVAQLTREEQKKVESISIKAFKRLGFCGYARIDVRFRDGTPYILETNANPSVYDAAEEIKDIEEEVIPGIKFPDYLQTIVESAFYHFRCGWEI